MHRLRAHAVQMLAVALRRIHNGVSHSRNELCPGISLDLGLCGEKRWTSDAD